MSNNSEEIVKKEARGLAMIPILVKFKRFQENTLEIKDMTLPIQFRFNNKKGLNFASTLLKIFKPEFYLNILREHNNND